MMAKHNSSKKILFLLFWSSLSLLSLLLPFVVFDVVIVILVIVAVVFVEVIVVIEGCNPLGWDNKDFESNCDFVIILRKVFFFWKLSSGKKSSPKIVKPLSKKVFYLSCKKKQKRHKRAELTTRLEKEGADKVAELIFNFFILIPVDVSPFTHLHTTRLPCQLPDWASQSMSSLLSSYTQPDHNGAIEPGQRPL